MRSALLLALGLLALPRPGLADDCRDDLASARLGMIAMPAPARLRPVSSREALDMIGRRGGALTFRREVEDFWRRKVRRSVDPHRLKVRYSIDGNGESTGRATHSHSRAQSFAVRLLPKAPQVLCEDREYRIISGGFTLMARADGIGLAGLYALEIDVDVEER